jgi:hypothetical protein
MYFLQQIKTQFIHSIVNYQIAPGEASREVTEPIVTPDVRESDWYNTLSPEEQNILRNATQADLTALMIESGEMTDVARVSNSYFDNLDSQDWFTGLSEIQKQEVRDIEKEIEDELQPYIDTQSNYASIMITQYDSLLVHPGEDDSELLEVSERLMSIVSSVNMSRARVEALMSKVRNIETWEVTEQRYSLVQDEYQDLLDSPDLEDSQKYIIWEKTFDELTAGDFYALKKEKPELLATLLLSTVDGNKVTPDVLKTIWTELRVNFASNSALDQIIGAGDILPMKSVLKVEINGQVWERKGQPRPGFYTSEGQYLAIHDGYKIKILEINELDEAAWTEFMTHVDKRYEDIRGAEVIQGISEQISAGGEDSLEFPQFMSDSDTGLLENYLSGKIPEYMKSSIVLGKTSENVPNITITEPYTSEEFSSVLDEYKNIRSAMSEYFSQNDTLLDNKDVNISLADFSEKTWIGVLNTDFIQAAFQSIMREWVNGVYVSTTNTSINITSTSTIREVFAFGWGNYDLREYAHLYPREASLKNNNPSGLTYNNTFMRTLQRHGIIAERGTARPSSEWWNYFGFPNIWEGIKAHNLLWDIKINRQRNNTLWQLLSTWAVDTASYRSQLWQYWNMNVGDIAENRPEIFHEIQMKQLRIESPWMYSVLQEKDLLSSYHTIRI